VSTASFNLLPGMSYFRNNGLVSPLVLVLWCFVAGIEFEWLCEAQVPGRRAWPRQVAGVMLAAVLAACAIFAFRLSLDHPSMLALVDAMSTPGVDRPAHTQVADVLAGRLWTSTIVAVVSAIVVGFGAAMFCVPQLTSRPRARQLWLWVVLLLVAADVYHFKFGYLFSRSDVIPASVRFVERPERMTYSARRAIDLKRAAIEGSNRRLNATLEFSPMFRRRLQGTASLGAQYWTNNMFVFEDEAGSTFQVDSWLKPLDLLIRMYWRVPIDDTTRFPPGVDLRQLEFPLDHPAAARVAGVTADKIRFFSQAYAVDSADALPPLMTDAGYAGNILFVLREKGAVPLFPEAVKWSGQMPLSSDDSQPLRYRVDAFDANSLQVTVSNPGPASWMSYADVWHPFWRATVNGHAVPVYQANMAYKAVPIERGENVVHFQFGSRLFSWLSAILAVNAAFWLATIASMMLGLLV
jgi:hypothetical protein